MRIAGYCSQLVDCLLFCMFRQINFWGTGRRRGREKEYLWENLSEILLSKGAVGTELPILHRIFLRHLQQFGENFTCNE